MNQRNSINATVRRRMAGGGGGRTGKEQRITINRKYKTGWKKRKKPLKR